MAGPKTSLLGNYHRPGRWSLPIDYGGRGGTLDSYVVRYDSAREKFFGTLSQLMPPGVAE